MSHTDFICHYLWKRFIFFLLILQPFKKRSSILWWLRHSTALLPDNRRRFDFVGKVDGRFLFLFVFQHRFGLLSSVTVFIFDFEVKGRFLIFAVQFGGTLEWRCMFLSGICRKCFPTVIKYTFLRNFHHLIFFDLRLKQSSFILL